ncbi:MAG: GNAT family N-acetyltransferase [Adhaeribacter sp.]
MCPADGLVFLHPHQVEASLWEACLALSPQALVYAHAWYLDAVCDRWSAVVELRDGRYVSLLPLPEKSLAGLRQVYQPFFSQQLGLFTTAGSRETNLSAYLAVLPATYWRVYLQLNTHNPAPSLAGYQVKTRRTYHLPLDRPYAALYKGYSTNQKRNIRKAPAEARVEAGDMNPLIALFREQKGSQVPALKDRDYARLLALYEQLRRHQAGQVLELRAGEGLLAAALVLESPQSLIYLFGASTPAGRRQGGMARLLDHLIASHAGSGRVLDFEGSDLPALAKFYANFGAQPRTYVSLCRTSLAFLPSWLNPKFLF